jgi:hypothetical protein
MPYRQLPPISPDEVPRDTQGSIEDNHNVYMKMERIGEEERKKDEKSQSQQGKVGSRLYKRLYLHLPLLSSYRLEVPNRPLGL